MNTFFQVGRQNVIRRQHRDSLEARLLNFVRSHIKGDGWLSMTEAEMARQLQLTAIKVNQLLRLLVGKGMISIETRITAKGKERRIRATHG